MKKRGKKPRKMITSCQIKYKPHLAVTIKNTHKTTTKYDGSNSVSYVFLGNQREQTESEQDSNKVEPQIRRLKQGRKLTVPAIGRGRTWPELEVEGNCAGA